MRTFRILITISLVALYFSACKKEEETALVLETGTVADIDGNVYKTVKIGNQWWMSENLRVKRFNDGSDLSYVGMFQEDSLWALSTASTYTYLNDTVYGCLYNQAAVQDARKLAPAGWHVPTDEDWKTLEKEIGMAAAETEKLAWRGTNEAELLLPAYSEGWPISTIPFGNDKYKMKILPTGCKLFNGKSSIDGNVAFFWTSTLSGEEAWYRYFDYKKKTIFRQHTYAQYGMSIRCVKD